MENVETRIPKHDQVDGVHGNSGSRVPKRMRIVDINTTTRWALHKNLVKRVQCWLGKTSQGRTTP